MWIIGFYFYFYGVLALIISSTVSDNDLTLESVASLWIESKKS